MLPANLLVARYEITLSPPAAPPVQRSVGEINKYWISVTKRVIENEYDLDVDNNAAQAGALLRRCGGSVPGMLYVRRYLYRRSSSAPSSEHNMEEGRGGGCNKERGVSLRTIVIHSFIHSIATDSSAFPRAVVSTQSVSSIAPVP